MKYKDFKTPREFSDTLEWRDVQVLTERSVFEVFDAKRKSKQPAKDFINDQDSVSGPGVLDNLIRNILTVRKGTFLGDQRFGLSVDSLLFEQLDWANLEFMRSVILNDLNNQLPGNITVTHIELSTNETWDTLFISIAYNIRLKENETSWQQPGPETIGGRKAYVNLSLSGIRD